MANNKKMIVVVDRSGSMSSSNKLQSAKSNAMKIISNYSEYSLYFFNDAVQGPLDKNSFSKSGVSGGTRIQKCLFDLFGNKLSIELNKTNKKYTEFWFITDAEDSINNVDGVIEARRQCQSKYQQKGKKLYCKEFIVGSSSGSCVAALKRIFDGGHFEGNSEDLDSLLKKAANATKEAEQGRTQCDQIESTLNTLSYSGQNSIQATIQKIEGINQKMSSIKSDVESVENSVNSAKTEYQNLRQEHDEIEQLAQCAQTQQEIDNAETKSLDLSEKYSEIQMKLNQAQIKAVEAMQQVMKQQDVVNQTITDTQNNGNKLNQQLNGVKQQINQLKNRLNGIQKSEEAVDIKKDIKKHIKTIRKLFEDRGKATTQLFKLQKEILRSFSALKSNPNEIDQLKRDVSAKMDRLDQIMESLDERA